MFAQIKSSLQEAVSRYVGFMMDIPDMIVGRNTEYYWIGQTPTHRGNDARVVIGEKLMR